MTIFYHFLQGETKWRIISQWERQSWKKKKQLWKKATRSTGTVSYTHLATPFIMLVVAFKAFDLLRRDGLLPGSGPGEKKAPPSQEGTAAAPRAGGADIGGSENE